MSIKIGIDVRCLTEPQYSGISEYTYNLIYHLLKIDQDNQYILFYNSAKKGRAVPIFKSDNVEYQKFNYPNKLFNLALRFLKFKAIDKMIGGVDVFLTPSFLFSNLSSHCRHILVVHDLSFELYPEFFTFKKRLWHRLIGPKQLCQQADLIIAVSENTKNDVIKVYGTSSSKIIVSYMGINEIFFQPITLEAEQKVKTKYNLNHDYIYYIGNLEPRKNVETIIQAFEKMKNKSIDLVIAGGQAWKYKNILKLWQNSPSKDRIKFLGYVNSHERPALYAAAKVFVYPSIYEGFGLPPLEAMACGTPVITSFNSSLVEAVDQAGLLIDQNNLTELSTVIDKLLGDKDLQAHLSQQGYLQATKFKWRQTAKQVLKLIKERQI
jgi:glycosyltransferase involved in cell wall biosynthesis